ncbi:MAG: indolepyruvate/phenylpyruvate decarboxylase [Alphaproteobacteria bacterium]
MQLAQALLAALKDHGARQVFGIPGDFALAFFKVIEESGVLPLYTLSHEPGVGFAADAAGRAGCTLGVAAVTYGAGALNLVNAVAGACAERSPVVVISGAPGTAERAAGLALHHQAKTLDSQFRVFREITCDQARLDDPERAPAAIARVLRSAHEQSMPVYLELPRDKVTARCAAVEKAPPSPVAPEALAECAGEILARLEAARAPVLMAGVEIRRYGIEDKVADLARRLGLPVVTSFMGRGLLADSNAPPLGTYLGVAGDPEITELVENSDGLLLLGVILCDTNFGVSHHQIDLRAAIQALGRRVRAGYHVYPDIPLDALVDALLDRAPKGAESAPSAAAATGYPTGLVRDDAPITPTDIARAVNDMMRVRGAMPISCDVGDCLFTAMDIEHTRLAAPGYYAGMGFGVPGGLGIQAALDERPLILVGDGAFQMTGWELGNCRRYGWDPIVLLFNNASWEMLRVFQPESRFNDLDDWRFAAMAGALGGVGERVTTRAALGAALDRAAATRGRFRLIEIMLERGVWSNTLARFVAGLKRGRPREA